MASELTGRRVAFLTANEGVEQVELTAPWQAVKDAGGTPELLAPKTGTVQGFNHLDRADRFEVHRSVRDADPLDYDALVVPGGVANADELRAVPAAVTFAQRIFEMGKTAAVICHGPWLLVEADLVRARTLTSWPSLKTDIRNAGGQLGGRRGPGVHRWPERHRHQPEAGRPARVLRGAGQAVPAAVPAVLSAEPHPGRRESSRGRL